jgi:hypothetical protein
MSVEIPVRRISVEAATKNPKSKGFILEFIVVDSYTINTILLADKDPTLVATEYITIASDDFHRGCGDVDDNGELVEGSLETFSDFATRALSESLAWSLEEIEAHKGSEKLVVALREVLPPAIDR